MAHKILSVSILEDKIDILKLELGMLNTYHAVSEVQSDVDRETVSKAAKWADEIRVNADFASADHCWNVFPKVSNRQLKQLVKRHAMQHLETRRNIRFGHRNLGQTTIEGVARSRVVYLAAEEVDVDEWERKVFKKQHKKIRHVTSLPVALASAVAQSEHPQKDFMVAWSCEMSTIFVISSPQGDVKVARNIPVGIERNYIPMQEDDGVVESFSKEFDRDIMTTLLLYHDTFAEPSCESFYLLGNKRLEAAFEQYPLKSVGEHDVFALDNLPVRGLKDNDTRAYHLLGNLFTSNYNLIDPAISREQQFDVGYKYACFVLLACITAAGAWVLSSKPTAGIEKRSLYESKVADLKSVSDDLYVLENKKIELNRFSGWKDFYKNTYTNQPAWSKMFSSLAGILPEQFIINNFEIRPGKDTGVYGWKCFVNGRINAVQWNDGLALFREFGTKIHQTPYFEIIDVQYTPLDDDQDAASQTTSFEFSIKMKLTPKENE